jgi:hypothetical protein
MAGVWFGFNQEPQSFSPMPRKTGDLFAFQGALPPNAWAAPCWHGRELVAILLIMDKEHRAARKDLLGPISRDFIATIDVAGLARRTKIGWAPAG